MLPYIAYMDPMGLGLHHFRNISNEVAGGYATMVRVG